jgi:hypothetical protein
MAGIVEHRGVAALRLDDRAHLLERAAVVERAPPRAAPPRVGRAPPSTSISAASASVTSRRSAGPSPRSAARTPRSPARCRRRAQRPVHRREQRNHRFPVRLADADHRARQFRARAGSGMNAPLPSFTSSTSASMPLRQLLAHDARGDERDRLDRAVTSRSAYSRRSSGATSVVCA